MPDASEAFISIEKIWHRPLGLLAAESILLSALGVLLKEIGLDVHVNVIVCGLASLVVFLSWACSRRLPRTKKNKIGFVVSLYCEDEETQNIIRSDFVLTLRRLITAGQAGQLFDFIEIPRHVASNVIEQGDALRLQHKTKAHFILYGRSRRRQISGKTMDIIELDGLVAHNPITSELQEKFANEFTELFPNRLAIDKENGIFAFQLTSEWTELVAKYIIAIASTVSGDLAYAEDLYNEIQPKLQASKSNIPIYTKLKERIPIRLAEIYDVRSNHYVSQWFKTLTIILLIKPWVSYQSYQTESSY